MSLSEAILNNATAEISVLFDKGEPKPESRSDFWEFRAIDNKGPRHETAFLNQCFALAGLQKFCAGNSWEYSTSNDAHMYGKSDRRYPQTKFWHEVCERLSALEGVAVTNTADAPVIGSWIDFTFRGHKFIINADSGEFVFFVEDTDCPESVLVRRSLRISSRS